MSAGFGAHQTVRSWCGGPGPTACGRMPAAQLTRRVRGAHGRSAEPTRPGSWIRKASSPALNKVSVAFDDQENQGRQAPCPDLLARLCSGDCRYRRPMSTTRGRRFFMDRAVENGFRLDRVKVDGIYTGPTIEAVSGRHKVEFQVSTRNSKSGRFAPLPLRWRIEATFGTMTNRYRRLTRSMLQTASEESRSAFNSPISARSCVSMPETFKVFHSQTDSMTV